MLFAGNQPIFRDRIDAGCRLGELLKQHELTGTIIAAIPRGGVPVGLAAVDILKARFEIIVARKIQIPWEPEAGYGAVTQDGTLVLNEQMVAHLGLSRHDIEVQADSVLTEIRRRLKVFRRYVTPADIAGNTVTVVDDGLASGFTALAAIKSLRIRQAERVFVAAPVASKSAFDMLQAEADEVITLYTASAGSFAVASFYQNWYDLTDEDVIKYLLDARKGLTYRRRDGNLSGQNTYSGC